MKAKAFTNGSAIMLVATIGLVSSARGRIQPHGHQHGDVLGRILHKPTVSSYSSTLVTANDSENYKTEMRGHCYADGRHRVF